MYSLHRGFVLLFIFKGFEVESGIDILVGCFGFVSLWVCGVPVVVRVLVDRRLDSFVDLLKSSQLLKKISWVQFQWIRAWKFSDR